MEFKAARESSFPRFPYMSESILKICVMEAEDLDVVKVYMFKSSVESHAQMEFRTEAPYMKEKAVFICSSCMFANFKIRNVKKVYFLSETKFSDLGFEDVYAAMVSRDKTKESWAGYHAAPPSVFTFMKNSFYGFEFGHAILEVVNKEKRVKEQVKMPILKLNFFPSNKWLSQNFNNKCRYMLPNFKFLFLEEDKVISINKMIIQVPDDKLTMRDKRSFRSFNFELYHYSYNPQSIDDLQFVSKVKYNGDIIEKVLKITKDVEVKFSDREMEEMSATISTGRLTEVASRRDVNLYHRARHNLMVDQVMRDLDVSEEFIGLGGDMDMTEIFDEYSQELQEIKLTPDIIYCAETVTNVDSWANLIRIFDTDYKPDDVFFVEVKVPDRSTSVSAREASLVYNQMARRFYEITGRRTRVIVVSVPMMEIDTALDNYHFRDETIALIRRMSMHYKENMSRNPAYKKFTTTMNYNISDNDYKEFFSVMMTEMEYISLQEAFLEKTEEESKNATIRNMRQTDAIMSEVKDFSMSSAEMDAYLKKIVRKIMDSLLSEDSSWSKRYQEVLFSNERVKSEIHSYIDRMLKDASKKEMDMEKSAFKIPYIDDDTKFNSLDFEGFMKLKFKKTAKELKLDDGTFFGNFAEAMMDGEEEFVNTKNDGKDRAGMRLSYDAAILFEEEFLQLMTMESSEEFSLKVKKIANMMVQKDSGTFIKKIMRNKLFESAYRLKELMLDIIQVQGRRMSYKKMLNQDFVTNSKFSTFKVFDRYAIEIRKGSKMTANKKIRYRIWISEDSSVKTTLFHKFHNSNAPGFMCTKYLSIDSHDLEHYSNLYDKMVYVAISTFKKLQNAAKELPSAFRSLTSDLDEVRRMLIGRFAMMYDHRRTTSAAIEISRYMILGSVSLMQDRYKIMKSIGETPIRSKAHNYYLIKQLDWYKYSASIWEDNINSMAEATYKVSDTYYDYFEMKSMFCDLTVDIDVMLDEMYIYTLTSKEQGEISHLTEATLEKMAEDEVKFRAMRREEVTKTTIRGYLDIDSPRFKATNTDYFEFDRKTVYIGTTMAMKTVSMDAVYQNFLDYLFEPLTEIATMKSSVSDFPKNMSYRTNSLKKEKRNKAMFTQTQLMRRFGLFYMVEATNAFNKWDLYFAEFPKKQLAKAREILIQDIFSRPKVRLHEKFFECVIKQMNYDMLTKGNEKFFRQADAFSRMLNNLAIKSTSSTDEFFRFSCNRDHSHWAPSVVTIQYMYMIRAMNLPEVLENYLMTCCAAFMHKVIGAPTIVQNKLATQVKNARKLNIEEGKKNEEKTLTELIENKSQYVKWYYNDMKYREENYTTFYSGFGQGMLHNTSSMYHNAEKVLVNYLYTNLLRTSNTPIEVDSLISSDDNTDMVMILVQNKNNLPAYLLMYTTCNWMISKLFNMTENTKKTTISTIVSEFNSQYMVFKRTLQPIIKYVYGVFSIPDSTCPEDAVRDLIGKEAILLEHGADFESLRVARYLHSDMLKKIYKLEGKLDEICFAFGDLSTEMKDEISYLFELGFLSEKYLFESIILGPDVYMYAAKNERIKRFRNNLMLVNPDDSYYNLRNRTVYANEMIYKQALVLPTKLTKRLLAFKKEMEYNKDLFDTTKDTRLDLFVDRFHNPNDMDLLINNKLGNLNLRYDMDPTVMYRVESVIRANSLVSRLNPIMKIEQDEFTVVTVMDFIKEFYNRTPSYDMLSDHPLANFYKEVINMADEMMARAWIMPTVEAGKHAKMRKVEFQNIADFPSISSKMGLDLLLSNKASLSKRNTMRLNAIQRFYGLTEEFEMIDLVKKIHSLSSSVASNIMTMLRNISKITGSKSLFFAFETANSINYKMNWLNLYKYRFISNKILLFSQADADVFKTEATFYGDMLENIRCLPLITKNVQDMTTITKALMEKKNIQFEMETLRPNFSNAELVCKTLSLMMKYQFDVLDFQETLEYRIYFTCLDMRKIKEKTKFNRAMFWIDDKKVYVMLISDNHKRFNTLFFRTNEMQSMLTSHTVTQMMTADAHNLISKGYNQDHSMTWDRFSEGTGMAANMGAFWIYELKPMIAYSYDKPWVIVNKQKKTFSLVSGFNIVDIHGDPIQVKGINLFTSNYMTSLTSDMMEMWSRMDELLKLGEIEISTWEKYDIYTMTAVDLTAKDLSEIEKISKVLMNEPMKEEVHKIEEEMEDLNEEDAEALEELFRSGMKGVADKIPELFAGLEDQLGLVMDENLSSVISEIGTLFDKLGANLTLKAKDSKTFMDVDLLKIQKTNAIEVVCKHLLKILSKDTHMIRAAFANTVKALNKYKERLKSMKREVNWEYNVNQIAAASIIDSLWRRNMKSEMEWMLYRWNTENEPEFELPVPVYPIIPNSAMQLLTKYIANMLDKESIATNFDKILPENLNIPENLSFMSEDDFMFEEVKRKYDEAQFTKLFGA